MTRSRPRWSRSIGSGAATSARLALARRGEDPLGLAAVAPAARLRPLRRLEILVPLEEVLDLVAQLVLDVVDVGDALERGSPSGTQRSFSSGPFSSSMWKTPIARTRIRQPGNVGSETSTSASSGSPSSASVPSTKP